LYDSSHIFIHYPQVITFEFVSLGRMIDHAVIGDLWHITSNTLALESGKLHSIPDFKGFALWNGDGSGWHWEAELL